MNKEMNYAEAMKIYESTDVYSTCGGFYSAEYRDGDLVYIIENEYANCLSAFDGKADEDEIFTEDNMIFSKDADELDNDNYMIYLGMLKKLCNL